MISVVTFDLWGTLIKNVSYKEDRLRMLIDILKSNNINISYETLKKAYKVMNTYLDAVRHSENNRFVTQHERMNYLIKECLGINISIKLQNEILVKFQAVVLNNPPPLLDNVNYVLEEFSSKYTLAIISDTGLTSSKTLRQVLDLYGILKYFSFLIFSDEVGFNKPHPLMFSSILNYKKVCLPEVIHIGDLLDTDIMGAKSFGINAIWLNQKGLKDYSSIEFQPDFEAVDLNEVLTILKTI